MSVTVESDLKEILTKIDSRLDKFETKLDDLSKDMTILKVGQARLEEKTDGEMIGALTVFFWHKV